MDYVAFISEQYIKEFTALDENVDFSLVKPTIRDNQELHILSMLGTDLYNRCLQLVTDKIDNNTPIPSPYDELINTYVRKVLLFKTMTDITDFISLKMRNNGVIIQGNELGSAASTTERDRLSKKYDAKAYAWQKKFEAWICDYEDQIPEYCDNDDDGEFRARKIKQFGGLYLG